MREESSFRDPNGFIFYHNQHLYRAVAMRYKDNYDHLMNSGLYTRLTEAGYLIPHREVSSEKLEIKGMYKVLEPERITFISYPYEWSFTQLKDAALLTLEIQKIALDHGMSLKDASAFNIQFHNGRPVFIDTLSFEIYPVDQPWIAYKQFCQHFLAPIALMKYKDVRLNELLKNHIDGVPLDMAHKLLPLKTRFITGVLLHIHLHASAQKKYNSNSVKVSELKRKFSKNSFFFLLNSLKTTIEHLNWDQKGTEWGGYTEPGVHSSVYTETKKRLVSELIALVKPELTWDLGANNGVFSRIAAMKANLVLACDIDPACVDYNYREVKSKKETNILPLLMDLTNPSTSMGWANSERKSLTDRAPADLILFLALIHHLAIGNNLPLEKIADYLSKLSKWIIIEYVPKEDDKVQILLKNRADIFDNYTLEHFEKIFADFFLIEKKQNIEGSKRILYLMKNRNEFRKDKKNNQ